MNGENAEGERDSGGGGRRPAGLGGALIEGQIDDRRRQHAADRAQDRQYGRAAVGKGADRHLPADLQADEQEEQGQQTFGTPVADAQRQQPTGHADAQAGADELLVERAPSGVLTADQGRGRRDQQDKARGSGQIGERTRRALHPRTDRALERFEHGIEVPGAVVTLAVDENRRGPRDPVATAVGEVFLDVSSATAGSARSRSKRVHVEAGRDRRRRTRARASAAARGRRARRASPRSDPCRAAASAARDANSAPGCARSFGNCRNT